MTLTALLLFLLAASLGIVMIILGVRYHRSFIKIGVSHAVVGIAAFGVLITEIMSDTSNKYNNVAALLIVFTLIGGLMLFGLREEKKPPPMILVAIHAAMALMGILIIFLGLQTNQ